MLALSLGMFLMFLISFNVIIAIAFYPHYVKHLVDGYLHKRKIMKMIKEIEESGRYY